MASIQKHESTTGKITYKVRFRIGSAGKSESFATRKAAERFVKLVDAVGGARARAVMQEAEPKDVLDHILKDVAASWLEWKSAKRADGTPLRVKSTYTTTRYEQLVRNQIVPYLGSKPINLISEGDIQQWIDDLSANLAPKTVADAHSVMHAIYKWAGMKAQGIAIIDPCTETVLPRRRKNVAKGLRPAEWQILLQAATEVNQDAADLLQFMVLSGYRWSEAVAVRPIEVEDYGTDGLFVTMGRVMRRGQGGKFEFVENSAKSAAGMRRTKMSPEGAKMIRRRMQGLAPDDLLFTNEHGRMWYYTGFRHRYWTRPKNYRDAAPNRARIIEVAATLGLRRPIGIHMLRHTHAVLMLLSGEPMAAVQKRMGHEDVSTTIGVYGSMIGDVSDKGLDSLDAMLAGAEVSGFAEAEKIVAGVIEIEPAD